VSLKTPEVTQRVLNGRSFDAYAALPDGRTSALLFVDASQTAIAMTTTPNLALAGSAIASAHTVLLGVENQ